jgi:hypothetical protein
LIVAKSLCYKACSFCKSWHRKHTADEELPEHECHINFDGSSGSMEPKAVLDMYFWMYDQQVVVGHFVAADDSFIRARLKWSNASHMLNNNTTTPSKIINSNGKEVTKPDYGSIPVHMPEPTFIADPNHCHKTLASALYDLEELPKTDPKQDGLKQADVRTQRITKCKITNYCLTMTKMDCVNAYQRTLLSWLTHYNSRRQMKR